MRSKQSSRTDEERLRAFCKVVGDATSRRAVAGKTIKAALILRFGKLDSKPAVETQLGDRDDADALMLDLRKVLAPREDTYFPRIASIVRTSISDEELRLANDHNRRNWGIVLNEGLVQLDDGAGPYRTPEAWFDLLMNGEVFHEDAEKRAAFLAMPQDLQGIARASVINMLLRIMPIIRAERKLIEAGFDRGAFAFAL